MPDRPLHHIRNNAVGYIALFVALSGTSYAALTISGAQIRNQSIDAIKLEPEVNQCINSSVGDSPSRYRRSEGIGKHTRVRVSAIGNGESITWPHQRFGRNCLASVTPQLTPATGPYGSVTVQFSPAAGNLTIRGFGPDKLGRPQSAYVMIVCP